VSGDTVLIWLTVKQAAARAQVGRRVIYEAVARQQIRAARVGGKRALRFKPLWVDEFLEACAEPVEIRK
jgi:excisionase family DNA binding protein